MLFDILFVVITGSLFVSLLGLTVLAPALGRK